MKEIKRYIAVLLCAVMVLAAMYAGKTGTLEEEVEAFEYNDSLVVWYTDDSMTDFLNAMAVEYHEKYKVRVLPKLQSGDDYIESIYDASVNKEGAPDLYIAGNDTLEKAVLSGCASVIQDPNSRVSASTFPKTAIDAVTYDGQKVAYPYYFETSALIYNKTYMHDMVSDVVEAKSADNPDENAEDEEETTEVDEFAGLEGEELIEAYMQKSIPETFDDLLNFANEYNAPAEVESIYKWDVRDIFFNFFYIGNYVDLGGASGDNVDSINLYNLDAIKALQVYQDMNQFFSFESDDVTYAGVVDDFIHGKIVFASVTTDIVSKLEQAKAAGEFPYEYGIVMLPDLNEEMETRSLSLTSSLVVNGYSNKIKEANDFARYLCIDSADSLYEKTGKVPSVTGAVPEDSMEYAFVQEYGYSVPMPKMMATSNYWLQMEDTFAQVWSGKGVSKCLKELSEQVKYQITGSEVEETYIDEPAEETETVEYLDEEALKEAAKQEE